MKISFLMKSALGLVSVLVIVVLGAAAGGSFTSPPAETAPLPSSEFDRISYQQLLEQNEKTCTDDNCRYWNAYVRAGFIVTGDQNAGCEIYAKISDKSFALYPLVLAKRARYCAGDSATAKKLIEKLDQYAEKNTTAKWLQSIIYEGEINAARSGQLPGYFDLVGENFKKIRPKKQRIVILQTAVADAQRKNSDKLKMLQEELFKLAPRFKPAGNGDWWNVGVDAMNAHDYDLAVRSFRHVTSAKSTAPPVRRLAYDYLKLSYKALEQRPLALKATEQHFRLDQSFLKFKKRIGESAHNFLSSGLSLARFLWTDHRGRDAEKLLAKIEKNVKGKVALGDLYFMRGRINEEEGKTSDALHWMNLATEQTADLTLKNGFLWSIAWLNYKKGDFESARQNLDAAVKAETDAGKKFQYTFWLAKSIGKLGRQDEAQAIYNQIIDEDPLGYYSLLSYRELNKSLPKPQPPKADELSKIPRKLASLVGPTILPSPSPQSWLLFDWLISVGESRYARDFLDEEAPLPDTWADSDTVLFSRYARAGYYAPIFARIVKLTPVEKAQFLYEHSPLLFPRPYTEAVNDASHRSGLWPEYIFSIMRQESSFDPLSLSSANAYGLLQLLPSVGKKIAADLHAHYESSNDLLDPELNINFGAQHLRNYWNQFDGQFILATAAYNASPASVKNWVKTRFRGDPLEFIEDIPYDETRTYVKLVLRNFIQYQRLSASQGSIPFPEWCLEGIHAIKD